MMTTETSPEIRWARAKKQCANCPRICDSSPKLECEHPHRVDIQDLLTSGDTLGSILLSKFWDEGRFKPRPGESRPAVELLSREPTPDAKYNVVELN